MQILLVSDEADRKERVMTAALWIIAVVETIRMIEQSIQLRLIANDTKGRDNLYDEMIKSFKESDREYVRNLLEAFERQSGKE